MSKKKKKKFMDALCNYAEGVDERAIKILDSLAQCDFISKKIL